ncbi:MAG: stage III sporulation protein AF [Clostridiaceae bacterium]|nr:stage III sporulation protein AF [Clostridiaceae bacterium]
MWKSGWKLEKSQLQGREKWILLLVSGVILLFLAVPGGRNTEKTVSAVSEEEAASLETGDASASALSSQTQESSMRSYENELEQRVKELLKHVEGIGEVDVMITLRSSGERIFHVDQEKNRSSTEEKDSSGGTRKVLTEEIREESVLSGASGSQEPVVEKELEPEIAGVVISAQGGGSAAVKAEISEAMEALFGLPAHKIKVLKRAE